MRAARVGGRATAAFGATAAMVIAFGGAASAAPADSPPVADSGSPLAAPSSAFTPAGYVSDFSGVPSATLNLNEKVPAITCKAADTAPVYINSAITGTTGASQFDAAGVTIVMSCAGTTPSYYAFGSVDGNSSANITVNAGDVIGLALIVSTTFETASFGDNTVGGGTYIDGTGFNATAASVAVQGGSGTGHFPKFKPVKFSVIKLNSQNLGHWPTTVYNQVDGTGNIEIQAGPLSLKGNAFDDTFVANR